MSGGISLSSRRLRFAQWLPSAGDVCLLVGVMAVLYGVYRMAPPLAWILGGGLLLWVGLRLVHAERRAGP